MPRVVIKKKDYKQSDLSAYIVGRMYTLQIKQADMARELNITQPAFCNRLARGYFTYKDLLTIFKKLGATEEEIVRLMKL
ncbi:MAG: hypothetical protein K1W16_12790 [Lachnospiraceae bacterium]